MKIYVGNLAVATAEPELRRNFEQFGQVTSVVIPIDKVDNKPKGFGFVEMPTLDQANAAILGLNGKDLGGQLLTVNEARSGNNKIKETTGPTLYKPADQPANTLPDGNK